MCARCAASAAAVWIGLARPRGWERDTPGGAPTSRWLRGKGSLRGREAAVIAAAALRVVEAAVYARSRAFLIFSLSLYVCVCIVYNTCGTWRERVSELGFVGRADVIRL